MRLVEIFTFVKYCQLQSFVSPKLAEIEKNVVRHLIFHDVYFDYYYRPGNEEDRTGERIKPGYFFGVWSYIQSDVC